MNSSTGGLREDGGRVAQSVMNTTIITLLVQSEHRLSDYVNMIDSTVTRNTLLRAAAASSCITLHAAQLNAIQTAQRTTLLQHAKPPS